MARGGGNDSAEVRQHIEGNKVQERSEVPNEEADIVIRDGGDDGLEPGRYVESKGVNETCRGVQRGGRRC